MLVVMYCVNDVLQGSELAGWADGRYSFERIDLNHNFPDLNNIMWDAKELAADPSKVPNHYIPMPEYYTKDDATVRTHFSFSVCLYKKKQDSLSTFHLQANL